MPRYTPEARLSRGLYLLKVLCVCAVRVPPVTKGIGWGSYQFWPWSGGRLETFE